MNPQVLIKQQVGSLPLVDAGFPGGLMIDVLTSNTLDSAATAGIYRATGEGAAFDLVYPCHEYKYILNGTFKLKQDGVVKTAVRGDVVLIPKGSEFTVYPDAFEAFFVVGRNAAFTSAAL